MTERIRAVAQRLVGVELWVVVGLVAGSLISHRLAWIALMVAGVFWLARWVAYGYLTVRTPADWPIALLVLMALVSLWATPLPAVTLRQVGGLLIGVSLYYSTVNWARSSVRLLHATYGLTLAGCVLALSAPLTAESFRVFSPTAKGAEPLARALVGLVPPPFAPGLTSALSGYVNPNVLAGALVVVVPLPLSAALFEWHEARRRAHAAGIAALLMILVLALTWSRGALLGLGAASLLLVGLRWQRGWLLAATVGTALLLAGLLVGPQRVFTVLLSTQALAGLDVRLEVWSRALYMIEDFPFTGIGFGAFGEVANRLYPFYLVAPETVIPHAHNLLLQIAADLGLLGLAAWLAIWLLVCIAAWSVHRRGRPDLWLAGLGAGLLGSQIALAVHGLTDAVTWGTRPAVVVWAVWGLAIASDILVRSERGGPATGVRRSL